MNDKKGQEMVVEELRNDLARVERDKIEVSLLSQAGTPLSSGFGTCKTVKVRLWPWLAGKSP